MPNDKPRALHVQYPFHAAPPPDCLQKQHSFFACVYRFSTTRKQLSTDSVNEEKKCLVKSEKVTLVSPKILSLGKAKEKGAHFLQNLNDFLKKLT
jgi:hypothetical protein